MPENKKNIKSNKVNNSVKNNQLKNQIEELTQALKQERADAINIRRRMEDERLKSASYYKASIITSFLPVIDNFDRALKHVPLELKDNSYIRGIEGIVKQFEDVLSNLGIQKIPTIDHEFNPVLHEAVAVDGEDGQIEIISEELQAGYKIDDTVIRPAMVKVKKVNKL